MDTVPFLAGWEPAPGLIKLEAKQLIEEGRDPDWIKDTLGAVDLSETAPPDPAAISNLWRRLQEAPQRAGFAFSCCSSRLGSRGGETGAFIENIPAIAAAEHSEIVAPPAQNQAKYAHQPERDGHHF